jgi:hypothetical protein
MLLQYTTLQQYDLQRDKYREEALQKIVTKISVSPAAGAHDSVVRVHTGRNRHAPQQCYSFVPGPTLVAGVHSSIVRFNGR